MEKHLDNYGTRLNRASVSEYKLFWSGYRVLVTLSGTVVAPFLVQAHRGFSSMLSLYEFLESGATGLILSLGSTYLYSRRKAAESLDMDWQNQLNFMGKELRMEQEAVVLERETVKRLAGEVTDLKKTKRTPAEQERYNLAKAALGKLPPEAVGALQHLLIHEKLTFGMHSSSPPAGMDHNKAQDIYSQCYQNNLVTRFIDPRTNHTSYEIAPGMKSALEELLYSNT